MILTSLWTQRDFGGIFKIIQVYERYDGASKMQIEHGSTFPRVAGRGWRVMGSGWRVEGNTGWRVAGSEWQVAGSGWRVAGSGWRVAGDG